MTGVIHLPALPGDPGHVDATFDDVVDAARRDADALSAGGIEHVIVENFGSAPFRKGTADDRTEPHVVALMTRVASECVARGLDVGVNCLRNDGIAAIGIAAACGASFVRINVLSGAYLTDQGVIESDAAAVMRYRKVLDPTIAVLADVLVKHAQPLAPVDVEQAIEDTVHRAYADAVIVSGSGTGEVTALDRVERAAATGACVLIGSGVTAGNMKHYAPHVHGVIVGTALKKGGDVHAPVDAARVREVIEAWEACR